MTEARNHVAWSANRIAEVTGQPPPTEEQRAVIEAPLAAMLVVAGAGSGKTETMASRVVYLLANRIIEPGEVLGLTFTRKAAAELAERIRRRVRQIRAAGAEIDVEDRPRVATYNSYAASIVRDHALRLGFSPDAVHIGEAGRLLLADEIVTTWAGEIETTNAVTTLIDAVGALESEMNEHGVSPEAAREAYARLADDVDRFSPKPSTEPAKIASRLRTRAQLIDLVQAFIDRKHDRGLIDFGEEVRLAARIAAEAPEVGTAERDRYRVVLLDEYQDTSIAQVELLSALFGGGHPVTAVGDPHQAIYGWRGAAAGTLFDFPHAFTRSNGEPAATATLSTAWRNDVDVLAAANLVAAPLRKEAAGDVPVLQPRPGAGSGRVQVQMHETEAEEMAAVAAWIAEHRAAAPAGHAPSAAVLCRTRSQFSPLVAALAARGLPVQVVAMAGLLETPEVADIWSALIAVHDPGRGDALMRLLTGPSVGLGAADLLALGQWAAAQARRRSTGRAAGAPVVREEAELASLVEAIDQLPPPEWRDPQGRRLSSEARTRIQRLAGALRTLRELSYLSLPELVTATEQLLELDIEVAAQRPGPAGEARRNLDEFAAVAARFAGDAGGGTLGGFLAWLDAAYDEERGLAMPDPEPDPHAVQVMTVHAAKGLEWDIVAVPGLVEGTFPSQRPNAQGERRASGWLTGLATLPYELRGDHEHLPELDLSTAATVADVKGCIDDFKLQEGARELSEERRLAYVALTRARHSLLLLGSFWKSTRTRPSAPSLFLTELVTAGAADATEWREQSQYETHPAADEVVSVMWPAAPAAETSGDLAAVPAADDEVTRRWWRDAELLLAERDAAHGRQVPAPVHLSASAVVALGSDRERFLRDRRRPIPRRPSLAARRGTAFHAWVERHFGTQALLDADELPGAGDAELGDQPELETLIASFLESDWADRVPIAVEADVDTPIADITVRCRIDAVFDDGPGRFHVVDWKTGPPPRDPDELQARRLQLVLYRLAWSRYVGVPVDAVRASFHHVATNETIEAPDADPAHVTELISALRAGAVTA